MRARQSRHERPGNRASGAAALACALKTMRDGLMASAYPDQCRVCASPVESFDDGVACDDCWLDTEITPPLDQLVCEKCGAWLGGQRLCGMCGQFPFSAARSCGIYRGALEASILFLKSHPHICLRLRKMLSRTFRNHRAALESDVVIPIPLYRKRERERGFNQAGVIAKMIARDFQMRLDDRSLIRARPTERHRAGLDKADRAKSVERAFALARRGLVENMSILLVDDLFTTGSTISAATKTLIEAGARSVSVLTIARVQDRSKSGRGN